MEGEAEGKSGGMGGAVAVGAAEQCLIHEARSQAHGAVQELSTLHLVPHSVSGTENREGGVPLVKVVTVTSGT